MENIHKFVRQKLRTESYETIFMLTEDNKITENLYFHTGILISYIMWKKVSVFLMTGSREVSYKEADGPVTFRLQECSRLALCTISCVHMNSELKCHKFMLRPGQSLREQCILLPYASSEAYTWNLWCVCHMYKLRRLKEQCTNMYCITVRFLLTLHCITGACQSVQLLSLYWT
jgi:hypothetical protein